MNDKGFTFVEILAVIAIIGILSGIAIIGVSRYRESAKNKDYEALAKSSYNAMEEYMMAHPYKKEVSLETLDEGEFLSNRIDPATKNTNCNGSVEVNTVDEKNGVMDSNTYTVYLCCTNYKRKYTYPEGKVEEFIGIDKCNVEDTTPATIDPIPDPTKPTYTCPAGKYLPKAETICAPCINSYYCLGGTWNRNNDQDQGLKSCPNGYNNSTSGASKINECFMKVPENKYVKTANDSTPTSCQTNQIKPAHNVYYGNTSSCANKPTCKIEITSGTKGNNEWYKSDVKITMTTTDADIKGLATSKQSTNNKTTATITKDGTVTYYGYVKNSISEGSCSKTIKKDSTPPTCGTASGSSTSWTKSNRTIKQECKDSTSGCTTKYFEKTYSKDTKTSSDIIKDKAGNTKTCTYNVYVDKTAPTATFCKTTKYRTQRKCVHDTYCIKIDYKDNYILGKRSNLKEIWSGSTVNWKDATLSGAKNGDELAVGRGQSTLKVKSVTIADRAGNNNSYSNKSYSSLPWCS